MYSRAYAFAYAFITVYVVRLCALKNKRERCSAKRLLALSRNSGFAVRFRIVNPSSGFTFAGLPMTRLPSENLTIRNVQQKDVSRTASRIEAGNACKDYFKYTIDEAKSQVQNNSCTEINFA